MKKDHKINFFELLTLNNSKRLKEWLISNGKGPKIIRPIMFIDKDKIKEKN